MNSIDDICNEIDLRLSVHSALMDSGWSAMETAVVSLLNTNQNDISILKNLQVEQEVSAGLLAKKIDGLLDGNASDTYKIVLSNSFEAKAHQSLVNRLREATDAANSEADRLENEYFSLQEQIAAMKQRLVEKRRQLEQKQEEERKKKEEDERKKKKEEDERNERKKKKEEDERKKKKEEDERKKKKEEEEKRRQLLQKTGGKRRHQQIQHKPIKKLRDECFSPKNHNKTMDTDCDDDSFWSDGD